MELCLWMGLLVLGVGEEDETRHERARETLDPLLLRGARKRTFSAGSSITDEIKFIAYPL